jgi:hypothetical protein
MKVGSAGSTVERANSVGRSMRKRPLGGASLPANMVPSSSASASKFHTVANGLVTTTWHMEDWFGLFLQLGQFPQPG